VRVVPPPNDPLMVEWHVPIVSRSRDIEPSQHPRECEKPARPRCAAGDAYGLGMRSGEICRRGGHGWNRLRLCENALRDFGKRKLFYPRVPH
jgi:hypothetical protein